MEVIRQIAERVAVIETGRIVEIGPAWQIFGNPYPNASSALVARTPEPLGQTKAAVVLIVEDPGSSIA